MNSSMLPRLAGLGLLMGSFVCAGAMLVHPETPRDPFDGPLHVAYFPCLLLILLGLPVAVARESLRAGALGLVGALALWFGLALAEVPHAVIDATVLPALLADPSTNGLVSETSVLFANLMQGPFGFLLIVAEGLLLVGMVILPVATLRAGVLPRWPSLILLGGVAATLASMAVPTLPGAAGPFLLFAGLGGFGVASTFNLGPERIRSRARLSAITTVQQLLLFVGAAASVLILTIGQVGEAHASTAKTVDIVGTQELGAAAGEPFNFKQGRIVVQPNETVTWRNLGPEPHSISIVSTRDLPNDRPGQYLRGL